MRRILRHRPSPAMVIACIALAIALGGTSYAAITLPAGSVGTKQLKRNAVNSAKVKNRSLLAIDFKRGQLPRGPRGLQGATGAQGAQGIQGIQGVQGPPGTPDTSNFFTKDESDARFAAKGIFQVVADPRGWEPFTSADPLTFTRFNESLTVRRTSIGSNLLVLPIDIPSALNGTRVRINSVRYCYDAAAQAALSLFQVSMYRWNDNGTRTFLGAPSDGTNRTDAACRTLSLATTPELTGTEHIAALVDIDWTTANTDFDLGSVTLNMAPVATGATVASVPSAPPDAQGPVAGSQ